MWPYLSRREKEETLNALWALGWLVVAACIFFVCHRKVLLWIYSGD